jgi:hypothetical protein
MGAAIGSTVFRRAKAPTDCRKIFESQPPPNSRIIWGDHAVDATRPCTTTATIAAIARRSSRLPARCERQSGDPTRRQQPRRLKRLPPELRRAFDAMTASGNTRQPRSEFGNNGGYPGNGGNYRSRPVSGPAAMTGASLIRVGVRRSRTPKFPPDALAALETTDANGDGVPSPTWRFGAAISCRSGATIIAMAAPIRRDLPKRPARAGHSVEGQSRIIIRTPARWNDADQGVRALESQSDFQGL